MSTTVSLDSWLGLAKQNNTITVNGSEPESKQIGGQTVVIQGNHCYVWIREGPWITAGREFGWKRKEPGFSVNETIVDYATTHSMTIRIINATNFNKCYEIAASDLVTFVNETSSMTDKFGVTLYVIPMSRCKTVKGDISTLLKTFSDGTISV